MLKMINNRNSLSEITLKDSLRPLEAWEASKKCMRSIYNIGPGGPIKLKKRKKQSNLAFGFSNRERVMSGGARSHAKISEIDNNEGHADLDGDANSTKQS